MARFIFGGEMVHLSAAQDTGNTTGNATALLLAPAGTAVPLRATPGGVVQTDFLLWDGSAFTITATSITVDSNSHLPVFQGPDGVSVLYDAQGYALLARDDPSGVAADWNTIANKPTFVAAGSTAALARAAIDAATTTEMTTLEAQTGTGTTGLLIEPAVLKAGIQRHAPANLYSMPIWDGTGTHPTRVDMNGIALPAGFKAHWFQPTAPLTGGNYAVAGWDLWTASGP